jgi:hypothetical protein
MDKRKLMLSLFSFLLSVFLSICVALAWFVKFSGVTFPPIDIESPLVESYELHFFTYDRIYKYDSTTLALQMYDETTATYGVPNYDNTEYQGTPFSGIFMSQYDPLIPNNNYHNNMIVEIHLHYNINQTMTARLSSVANPGNASDAVSVFNPDQVYYLSHFVNVQNMTASRIERTGGENIFDAANQAFINAASPYKSFYGTDNIYSSVLFLDDISFNPIANDIYIYINLVYHETKINEQFSGVWGGTPALRNSVLFFQDITFLIRKVEA